MPDPPLNLLLSCVFALGFSSIVIGAVYIRLIQLHKFCQFWNQNLPQTKASFSVAAGMPMTEWVHSVQGALIRVSEYIQLQ